MTPVMLIVAVVLASLGAPIAFVFILAAAVALATGGIIPVIQAVKKMYVGMDMFALLAIPLFMLAGQLMNAGGLTKRLMRFANAFVGHLTGGLAQVNILASMLFAGMSGSALADVVGLGSIEIPMMLDAGYDIEFTAGVTAASSIVGPVIPPSIDFIIYGTLAGVSVAGLFVGGAIPGIIMGASMMFLADYLSRKRGYPKGEWVGFSELMKAMLQGIPVLLTPVIILVGMLTSVFTPTEAGAIAVLYSTILSVAVYRELPLRELPGVVLESLLTSSSLMIVIAAANPFGWVIAYEKIPQHLAEYTLAMIHSPYLLLFVINVFLLFLGCFMESASLFILLTPILVPVIKSFGIDPLHFGIIMVVNLCIGTLTPPFGVCLFAASRIAGISFERTLRGVKPFYIPLLIALLIITYFPQVTLFLPRILLNY
ncbi:MAG: TRAP transporter large permease [Limnochordia bacterium]|jgi:tripartite ATP-independent transporter DctM subunit